MRKKAVLIFWVLAITGCASVTPRGDPPDLSYETAKPIETVTPCIIRGLDAIWDGYTHTAQTIAPNQEYEIRPNRQMLATADAYYVNVKRSASNSTDVNLYAVKAVEDETIPPVSKCR